MLVRSVCIHSIIAGVIKFVPSFLSVHCCFHLDSIVDFNSNSHREVLQFASTSQLFLYKGDICFKDSNVYPPESNMNLGNAWGFPGILFYLQLIRNDVCSASCSVWSSMTMV